MLPDETSLVCEDCGVFNLSDANVRNHKVYCIICFKRRFLKDRSKNE